MNRAEIIKAISEAGASFEDAEELQKFLPAFYAFEKIVAAAERERVAKEFDSSPNAEMFRQDIAEAIRALGGE